MLALRALTPRAGTLLGGRYRLGRRIGSGAAGEVWEAFDTRAREARAIKVLRADLADDPEVRRRFAFEAEAATKIEHPNVVRVFELAHTDQGLPYLVMELCDGETLDLVIDERGAVGVAYACELVVQVLDGLGAAHALGLVHRDLKPANITVVHTRPETPVVKVLDFGIAKSVRASLGDDDDAGRVFGTPDYMAPEQASGAAVDARADIYAAGVILYELVSGERPFVASSPEVMLARVIAQAPRPLRVEVPPALEQIVMQCLAKEPDQRPSSAALLRAALAPFVTPEPARELSDSAAPEARDSFPLLLVPRDERSSSKKTLQLVEDASKPPPKLELVDSIPPPPPDE